MGLGRSFGNAEARFNDSSFREEKRLSRMEIYKSGESAMSLPDELRKLQELRDDGTLSDSEFAQAKAKLLNDLPVRAPEPRDDKIGQAAETWVNFQIVMSIIGLILAAIVIFVFFVPIILQGRPGFP